MPGLCVLWYMAPSYWKVLLNFNFHCSYRRDRRKANGNTGSGGCIPPYCPSLMAPWTCSCWQNQSFIQKTLENRNIPQTEEQRSNLYPHPSSRLWMKYHFYEWNGKRALPGALGRRTLLFLRRKPWERQNTLYLHNDLLSGHEKDYA